MKITPKNLIPWVLALACLNLSGLTPTPTPRNNSKDAGDKDSRIESNASDGSAADCNRASNLIGMKVINQNDERLGKIKDIVIDLKNERVAYVVMSVNTMGVRAFTEKLMAVPLNALTVSPDNQNLVLRAEKEKIDLAAGFDPNNWPSASNPSWGAEPFWQKDKEESGKPDKDNSVKPGDQNEQTPKPEDQPDDK